ncbi:MAG: SDR family NAD(P)-dependent oxidoreductase [Acidobacteriota bacterium]
MQIQSAIALVTGGSSGIGLATAQKLIAGGAKVAICGRDQKKLDRAAADLGALGIHADVSVESDVVAMVCRVIDEFGDYNVLVNNAGFGAFAPLLETTLEQMQRVYATNVFGAMVAARESARHFVSKQYGNIVNVASTAALRGNAGGTAYSSSKFALHGLTECWRAELRKSNIRVMQINPSEVQTAFFHDRGYSPRKLHAEDIADAIVGMLAMEDRAFITEMSVWATNPE